MARITVSGPHCASGCVIVARLTREGIMSIDWFRSWHGAPTDNKWLVIAKRAGVPAGMVSAVVWALFDYASQNEDRGSVDGFDVETYATFSGFEDADVQAIIAALAEKNVIQDGYLAAWEKRQPKREDNSTERVRQHRNAVKRNVTQGNAREDKEKDTEEEKKETREPALVDDGWPVDFRDQFWDRYPHKVGKPTALAKLEAVRKRGVSWSALMDGLDRYIAAKPPDRPWLNPATFLNQERWNDQPATAAQATIVPDVSIDWEAQVERFSRGLPWSARWYGAEPGQTGCRAPPDVLAKFGFGQTG